jgi:hypothetical protein
MMALSSTWFLIALGVLAIGVLMLVMKLFAAKPKRAEKWEKAEIMKQLLALSEQEEQRRLAVPASRAKAQPVRPASRPTPSTLKASTKVAIPVRAKAR